MTEKASTDCENAGQIGPGKSARLIRENPDAEGGGNCPSGRVMPDDEWMNGYRAGLDRAAELVGLIKPRYCEAFIREEIAAALLRGYVADRGSPPLTVS